MPTTHTAHAKPPAPTRPATRKPPSHHGGSGRASAADAGASVRPPTSIAVAARSLRADLRGRVGCLQRAAQDGMTTAEYAVGTVAAVAFAGVLLVVVRSGPVKSALTSIITSALSTR